MLVRRVAFRVGGPGGPIEVGERHHSRGGGARRQLHDPPIGSVGDVDGPSAVHRHIGGLAGERQHRLGWFEPAATLCPVCAAEGR